MLTPGALASTSPSNPLVPPAAASLPVPAAPARVASTAPQQKPSEPAVISSASVDDEIATARMKLAQMGQKGTTMGSDGSMQYADGSLVPAPPQSTYNDKTGKYEYNGATYGAADFYGGADKQADPDYTAIQNLFAPLKAQVDAQTLNTINSIHSQYEALRSDQQDFNARANQARAQVLLLGGASRYAPLDAAGTMTAQTSYGLRQIQNLDDKENAAIAQARAAEASNNMKLMTDALAQAETVRKEKQDAAQKVLTQISDANQKLLEKRQELTTSTAVADAVTAGYTDPTMILQALTDSGVHITADQVDKALKALSVTGDASSIPADLKAFNYIKKNVGLPDDIAALPEGDQYFAYLKSLKEANASPTTGFTLGTNQVRYDSNGEVVARGPQGQVSSSKIAAAGGGASSKTFTQAQINKGAANAAATIDEFKNLDDDTKNYFVNGYSNFQALQKQVASNQYTKEEAAQFVRDSTTIPESAKPKLLEILGVSGGDAPATPSNNGFLGGLEQGLGWLAGHVLGI